MKNSGKQPQNALILMRSRYRAHAVGLVDYILKTTYKKIPDRNQVGAFWRTTSFIPKQPEESEDFVTLTAVLKQNPQDASFTVKR